MEILELIATEKAGIMKNKVLCISRSQEPKVEKVLKDQAKKVNAKLLLNGRDWNFSIRQNKINISYMHKKINISKPSLEGYHQTINAALACVPFLSNKNFKISNENITLGITKARWPGRLEKNKKSGHIRDLLDRSSEIWLDGGHNISGANVILNWLKSYKNIEDYESIVLICGFLQNKDVQNIILNFKDEVNKILFVPIENNKNSFSLFKIYLILLIL